MRAAHNTRTRKKNQQLFTNFLETIKKKTDKMKFHRTLHGIFETNKITKYISIQISQTNKMLFGSFPPFEPSPSILFNIHQFVFLDVTFDFQISNKLIFVYLFWL